MGWTKTRDSGPARRCAARALLTGLLLFARLSPGAGAGASATRREPSSGSRSAPVPGTRSIFGMIFGKTDLISRHDQARLRDALDRASRALGSPVAIEVVAHLAPAGGATPDARSGSRAAKAGADRGSIARDAFDAHGFDLEHADPVLLLVSVADRRAAVETGKGPAGIVPEIDARAITGALTRGLTTGNLAERLGRALEAIVSSAQATRERRQPQGPDDEPAGAPAGPAAAVHDRPPAGGAPAPAPAPAPRGGLPEGAEETSAPDEKAPAAPAPPAHSRSRLPIAAAIAVLVLLALALQRRRQFAATRAAAEERAARERLDLERRVKAAGGGGPPPRRPGSPG